MNSIINEIVAIKMEVLERNWEEMSLACRQSRIPIKEWCRQNGIHPSTEIISTVLGALKAC